MGRSPCCEKGHTTKGAWTKEEDQKLIQYIKAHGDGCWKSLPSAAGLSRCGKSCRLRWINYLRPDLKRGNFTVAEEQLIIQLHEKLGNKWSVIAMNLPGRTDNEIKNYWNTHIKRKLLSQGIDPQTHRQIAPADAQSVDPQTRNQISAAAQAVDPQTRNQISAAAASFSPSRYRPVQYDRAHGRSKILVDATSTSEPDSAAVSFMQSRLKRGRDALSGSSSSGGDGDGGFVDYQEAFACASISDSTAARLAPGNVFQEDSSSRNWRKGSRGRVINQNLCRMHASSSSSLVISSLEIVI